MPGLFSSAYISMASYTQDRKQRLKQTKLELR